MDDKDQYTDEDNRESADEPDSEGEFLDAYMEDARQALYSAQNNQRESHALREELNAYVDDMSNRKDSDGNKLITVPNNFGAIVNSMTREDLQVGDNGGQAPWSQYLLLDGLNAAADKEYGGRYTGVFSDTQDVKIQRGLAQIEMLDRQLQDAARRSATVPSSTAGADDDESHDPTFVTAGKRAGATPRAASSGQAVPGSGRREGPQATQRRKRDVAPPQTEQQRRQQLLLDSSDAAPSWEELQQQLGTYWDPEAEERDRALDRQLAQFGHLDRLLQEGGGADEEVDAAVPEHEQIAPDYLSERRAAREAKQRDDRIDELLRQCTSQPIQYDALLSEDAEDATFATGSGGTRAVGAGRSAPGTSGRHRGTASSVASAAPSSVGTRCSVAEVPAFEEVIPSRTVTQRDIQQLIAELKLPTQSRAGTGRGTGTGPEGFLAGPADAGITPATWDGGDPVEEQALGGLADSAAMRELVRRYQADVRALAEARRRGPRAQSAAEEVGAHSDRMSPQQMLPARQSSGSAKSPRFSAAIGAAQQYAGREAVDESGFLDWTEEAPQCVLNMAHPALAARHVQHAGARVEEAGGESEEEDAGGQGEVPAAWSLRMHAIPATGSNGHKSGAHGVAGRQSASRFLETEPVGAEVVPGWLPPLPPEGTGSQQASARNGSAGSRSSVGSLSTRSSRPSQAPGTEQPRSPVTKSLRSPQPADQEGRSVQVASSRSARHSYDAGSTGGGGGQWGYEKKQQQGGGGIGGGAGASSLHRANKASNVLSSMSTFLSREVVASTSPRDRTAPGTDTFRI